MFCFQCGYDLSRLQLPRPCPECGTIRDPQKDAAAARAWYAGKWAWFDWLFREKEVPLGVHYQLADDSSYDLARRRIYLWIYAPIVAVILLIFGTSCIRANFKVTATRQYAISPNQVESLTIEYTGRGDLFGEGPSSTNPPPLDDLHAYHSGAILRQSKIVRLNIESFSWQQPQLLKRPLLTWVFPLCLLIFSFIPGTWMFLFCLRDDRPLDDNRARICSATCLISLSAVPASICIFCYAALLFAYIIANATIVEYGSSNSVEYASAGAIGGLWGLLITIAPTIIARDHAKKFIRYRLLSTALSLFAYAAMPIIAASLIMHLT